MVLCTSNNISIVYKENVMNVGIFTDSYRPEISGVVVSVQTLKKSLTARGHRVYIFAPDNPEAQPEDDVYRLPSIPVIFQKSLRLAVSITPESLTAISQIKLDVIHTQTEFTLGFFAKAVARILDLPIIHTYHTMYKDYVHYITRGKLVQLSEDMVRVLSRKFCNADDMIIAPTDKVRNVLLSYGVKRPIRIVPSGVDLGRFQQAAADPESRNAVRKELGIDDTTPLIVFIGRIAKEKSIDMLIRSLPVLHEKLPEARLLVVGDGPEKATLENLATQICKSGSVIFTGSRPWVDIPSYYRAGDVFISASVTETQGLTILEAMAAEVPVVARQDPSFAAMITNGVDGRLFAGEADLPEALFQVLSDHEKTASIISAAREKALQYSAETFGQKLEETYTEVISRHKLRSRHFLRRIRRFIQTRKLAPR
jgi:1,2-diacylglycerol 3-alpha-glucosyltransferase